MVLIRGICVGSICAVLMASGSIAQGLDEKVDVSIALKVAGQTFRSSKKYADASEASQNRSGSPRSGLAAKGER